MTVRSRGEFANQTDTIQLIAEFRGPDGARADLDAFPQISIIQPSGNVGLEPTSAGVYHISTGMYGFNLEICYNCPIGVYTDVWTGTRSGFSVYQTGNFVVQNTQLPAINTDGYRHLGDDVEFCYSQNAMLSVNKVIKVVRARLNSAGKAKTTDAYGNVKYIDCDIYTVEQLATFVANSISAFNEIPHTTWFTWEDSSFVDQYLEVLAQHAAVLALASKVMIERGREFDITDNGASFKPPGVSDVLQTQYTTELTNWFEKIKLIKSHMKPSPLGLGSFSGIINSNHPAIMRLRHLKARRLY